MHERKRYRVPERNISTYLQGFLALILILSLSGCIRSGKATPPVETNKPDVLNTDNDLGVIPSSGIIMTTYHQWMGGLKFHTGYDIENEIGTEIISPMDGVVTKALYWTSYDDSFGNNVSISIGDPAVGCEISFGHLDNFVVEEGQEVKEGQLIGFIGASGLQGKFPPHLHIDEFCLHPSPAGFVDLANLIPSLKGVQVGTKVNQGD